MNIGNLKAKIYKNHEEDQDIIEGLELLETIWLEHGAYREKEISQETWNKLNNYFGFDDGE
jgi:hypothetical protein